MRKIARRSIVFKKNFQKGTVLSKSNFEFKRPGTGLPPSMVDSFIGKKLIVDVVKGSMITGDIIND
jgi:sialic acid synthase SpsE